MNRTRKMLFALVLVLMLGVVAGRFLFPFEYYQGIQWLELWRAGVRGFEENGLKGLLRDHCQEHDPEARGCTCVALIHGLGDEPATWKKILEAPKKRWEKPVRLYAIEMPRNQRFVEGESPETYRVSNQAVWLAGKLGPICPIWTVVGNSLGGWEGAWLALLDRIKVEKLILVDANGIRSATHTDVARLFSEPGPDQVREMVSRLYFKPHPLSDEFLKRAAAMMTQAHTGEVLRAQKEADYLDGKLSSLRLPTMVLWGAGDRLLPDTIGREIQAQIPSSVWREIPECGHVPQKECPEPVIQAINDMLRAGAM